MPDDQLLNTLINESCNVIEKHGGTLDGQLHNSRTVIGPLVTAQVATINGRRVIITISVGQSPE